MTSPIDDLKTVSVQEGASATASEAVGFRHIRISERQRRIRVNELNALIELKEQQTSHVTVRSSGSIIISSFWLLGLWAKLHVQNASIRI